MAIFQPIVITNAGLNLLSQAVAGQGTLTFTSIATSSTAIAYSPTTIQGMTSLSGIIQTAVPARALLQDGTAQVSAVFDNSGLSQGYTVNTLGLYATLGSGAQTLFAVAVASTPDNIPAPSSLPASSFYYQFNIAISDTSQLTIGIPDGGSLPSSVFNQMFPGIVAPDPDNDGDALVYNASSGAWGYVNTENALTTVGGSGEAVSLQKTLAGNFDQIQIFGKSIQEPTTGAQLFDLNAAKSYPEANITDYASGTFTVSRQSGQIAKSPALSEWCPTMQARETYYIYGNTTSSNKYVTINGTQWNFGGVFIPSEEDLSQPLTFSPTTQNGGAGNYQDTYSGIMITTSGTPVPYEVYTGGVAAAEPSPEYPLPIQSVGIKTSDGYEVPINVTGNQLFDASKLPTTSAGGATVTNNGDGSFTVSGTGTLSSDYTNIYSLGTAKSKKYIHPGMLWVERSNINPIFSPYIQADSKYYFLSQNPDSKKWGIEITEDMLQSDDFNLMYRYYGSNGSDIVEGEDTPLLHQSIEAIWELFKEPQQDIFTFDYPLYGAPVEAGGNYTDKEGQQWVSNFTDLKFKNYVKCMDLVALNSYDYQIESINQFGIVNFYTSLPLAATGEPNILCTHFANIKTPIAQTENECIYLVANTLYIRVLQSKINSATALKNWLSDNNVQLLYPLANPTATPLTPDQISTLEALQTFNPNTNIFSGTYPAAGLSVTAQGFNIAGDLAQNMIDLQSTVRSQGTAITQNETDIENINNVLNSPLVSYNGLLPVVNPSGIYTYKSVADIVYPIGSIYLSVNNINPGTIFGGTWVSWGSGQVPVGVNTSVSQFATVEQTGGEITHTLTTAEMPSHDHSISGGACTTGSGGSHNHTYGVTVHPAVGFTLGSNGYSTVTGDNQNTSSNGNHSHSVPDHAHDIGNTGGGQAHNNLQPYITCYMWKRTA